MSSGAGSASSERLRSHVRALEGLRHPELAPERLRDAEKYVAEELSRSGLQLQPHTFEHRGAVYHNVVGRLGHPNRHRVLLGAHFDAAWGTPGADDNASGVAVLLEVARLLSGLEPAACVEFVGFNLEEPQGFLRHRIGSRHYASDARAAGVRYRACLVLEMVGYTARDPGAQDVPTVLFWKSLPSTADYLAVVGDWRSRRLVREYREAAADASPGLTTVGFRSPFRGWLLPATRLSDHSRFWDQGYRALMLTDTAFFRNPNYHRPGDTADTLDYAFMQRVADATATAVRRLASGDGTANPPESEGPGDDVGSRVKRGE